MKLYNFTIKLHSILCVTFRMLIAVKITLAGALLLAIQLSTQAWQQEIYVDPISGIYNEACWSGGYSTPCADLNLALRGVEQYNTSTAIFVQPGNYLLSEGSENQLENKNQMAIIGNATVPSEVVIQCLSPAGLHFVASKELVIDTLTFNNCAVTYDNQTAKVLYFEYCENVKITNLFFLNSSGVASFFREAFGSVSISGSLFARSTCNSFQFECGGVVIETGSSPGDKSNSTIANYVLSNNTFVGNNVTVSNLGFNVRFCPQLGTYSAAGVGAGLNILFKGNSHGNQVLLLNNTFSNNGANFGGGLLIALCENATENSVTIEDSHFARNTATGGHNSYQRSGEGGGALVAIQNLEGGGNSILFSGCHFSNNIGFHGGGLAVISYSPQLEGPGMQLSVTNIVRVINTELVGNYALLGLALYFYHISFGYGGGGSKAVLSKVNMSSNALLDSNAGRGGGVLFSYDSSITLSEFVSLNDNADLTLLALDSNMFITQNAQVAVQGNRVLYGRVAVLECSTITIGADSVLKFEQNKNVSVVLYSSCGSNPSQVSNICFLQYEKDSIHPDLWKTQIIFRDNTGCSPNEDNWSCSSSESTIPAMIYDSNILSCAWPARGSDSISKSDLSDIFLWDSFNYFGKNSKATIKSGPTSIVSQDVFNVTIGEQIAFPIMVYDYIGNNITGKVTFRICVVGSSHYLVQGDEGDESNCIYTSANQTMTVFPKNGTTNAGPNVGFQVIDLDFATSGTREVSSRQTTHLFQCQPSFLFPERESCDFKLCTEQDGGDPIFCCSNSVSDCLAAGFSVDCVSMDCPSPQNNVSLCNAQSYFYMPYGRCFWANKSSGEARFGNCPPVYAITEQNDICLPTNVFYTEANNDDGTSDNCVQNRSGFLCGQCSGDLCVAINSVFFECAKYNPIGVLIFIMLEILPLTIFLLLLMFFGVSLNYLSTNSYILYAQMITLRFPGKSYPSWSLISEWPTKVVFIGILYSVWSLDFLLSLPLDPFCIFPGMTAIEVIAFQYITAAYPLIVAGITWVWVDMYARGVRPVFFITTPLQHLVARCSQRLKVERSLTETFAVMFVLSFTQLTRVSVQLLSFTTVSVASSTANGSLTRQSVFYYDASLGYFSAGHAPYALLALLVLSVFVVMPALFLLLYPLKTFKKLLTFIRLDGPTVQTIADAFIGCFKDGSSKDSNDGRFFAGFFLIFRVFFVALYTVPLGSNFAIFRIIYLTEEGIGLFVAGLIILFRPYKNFYSNVLDFFLFFFLGFLALVCAVTFGNYNVILAEYGPLYLPAFFLGCWLVYLITKWFLNEVCRRNQVPATSGNEEHDAEGSEVNVPVAANPDDYDFPDRLQNPEDYSKEDGSPEPVTLKTGSSVDVLEENGCTEPVTLETGISLEVTDVLDHAFSIN